MLLDLNGQVLFVDLEGGHCAKFVVTGVPVTPDKPHDLDYSLTLHGPRANGWSASITPIRSAEAGAASVWTIGHRLQTVRPYAYEDAATLLADFWQAVEAVLKERGAL